MNHIDGSELIMRYVTGDFPLKPRASFYSGRGATTSDLTDKQLEMIYRGIKKEFGDEEAANFVKFTAGIEKMSATAFLNKFLPWADNGCGAVKSTPHQKLDDLGFEKNERGEYNSAGLMAGMVGMMAGSNDRDDTIAIRDPFLRDHREELGDTPVIGQSGFNGSGHDKMSIFGDMPDDYRKSRS